MARLRTESDVAELLTKPDCIRAVEEAFRRQDGGTVTNLPRRRAGTSDHFRKLDENCTIFFLAKESVAEGICPVVPKERLFK